MKFCPYCGAKNLDDYRFCESCGRERVKTPSQQPAVQPQPSPPVQPTAPQSQYAPPPQQPAYQQPTAPPAYRPSASSRLLKPKMVVGVVVVVAIIVIGAVLWNFVLKPTEEEGRQIVGTVTMQELFNDLDLSTWSLKTYKAGTAVYLQDTVVNVTEMDTSYGYLTIVFFSVTVEGSTGELPLIFLKGDKRSEYTIGSTAKILTPIDEYTMCGRKIVTWGEEGMGLFYFWVSGLMAGGEQIVLNERFITGGNEKLVVATSSYYDSGYLNDYSVVLSKNVFVGSIGFETTKTTVDSIPSLSSSATSSGGHIAFTDANYNGELDSGDYFIISMGTTNSKYVWDIYSLTLKRENSEILCDSLFLGYKGFFYVESYDEPTAPMFAMSTVSGVMSQAVHQQL